MQLMGYLIDIFLVFLGKVDDTLIHNHSIVHMCSTLVSSRLPVGFWPLIA